MSFQIIKSEQLKTNKWAGGTTTQLYIFPNTSDYKKQDFVFRISSAKVELEESNFTLLPNVSRKLMILDGEIEIRHKDHYHKKLTRFEIDEFKGDWNTSSVGKCIDFNLMTIGNIKSDFSAINLEKNQDVNLDITSKWSHYFVYNFSGEVSINIGSGLKTLEKGDLLIIENSEISMFQILAVIKTDLVFSRVDLGIKKKTP